MSAKESWQVGRDVGAYLHASLCTSERPERGGPCWLLKLRQMGTNEVQMKGVLPWLFFVGLSCRHKRFSSCLGCSSQPSNKYFFPHRHPISLYLSPPIALQPGQSGMQACRVACLSPVSASSAWPEDELRFRLGPTIVLILVGLTWAFISVPIRRVSLVKAYEGKEPFFWPIAVNRLCWHTQRRMRLNNGRAT